MLCRSTVFEVDGASYGGGVCSHVDPASLYFFQQSKTWFWSLGWAHSHLWGLNLLWEPACSSQWSVLPLILYIHLFLVFLWGKLLYLLYVYYFNWNLKAKFGLRINELNKTAYRAQEQGVEATAEHLGRLYVFSLMWSIGALLEPAGRRRMEHWLRAPETPDLDLPPPAGTDDTMFDYYVTSDGETPASFHT